MRPTFIAGLAVVLAASTASGQEVTLRAVSSFAEGTEFSKNFERFVEKVNADARA
jgi:TRAP-type transport system periplasmic protein